MCTILLVSSALSSRLTSHAFEAGNGRNLLFNLDFELDPPDSVVIVVGAPEEDCPPLPLPFLDWPGLQSRPCGGDSEFEVMGSWWRRDHVLCKLDVQVVFVS